MPGLKTGADTSPHSTDNEAPYFLYLIQSRMLFKTKVLWYMSKVKFTNWLIKQQIQRGLFDAL